jgi:hypothetical protein
MDDSCDVAVRLDVDDKSDALSAISDALSAISDAQPEMSDAQPDMSDTVFTMSDAEDDMPESVSGKVEVIDIVFEVGRSTKFS